MSARSASLRLNRASEVIAVHSVAGLLAPGAPLNAGPRSSRHTTSSLAALVGGGSGLAKPVDSGK